MKTYTVTISNEVTKWYRDGALHEVGVPSLPEEAADVWSTIEKPDSIQQLLRTAPMAARKYQLTEL